MASVTLVVGLIATLIVVTLGLETIENKPERTIDEKFAMHYLQKFGYLHKVTPTSDPESDDPADIHRALLEFQTLSDLPRTGTLDKDTKAQMLAPVCVIPDHHHVHKRRRKRFKLHRFHWRGNLVTYNIFKGSSKISPQELDQIVRKSFKYWTDVANFKALRVKTNEPKAVNIGIRFERGYHEDNNTFDGPGGFLAHTSFPPRGRIHLDDDEPWTTSEYQSPYQRDLLGVLVHEIGHSLGLAHSSVPSAVMYRFYKQYSPGNFRLDIDDIKAIQELYGKPPTGSPYYMTENRIGSHSSTVGLNRRPTTKWPRSHSSYTTPRKPFYGSTRNPFYRFSSEGPRYATVYWM